MKPRPLTSPSHELVKHFVKLRDDRSYRDECGTVLIQGHKMISEVGRRQHVLRLMVTQEELAPVGLTPDDLIIASESVLHKVSGVRSSEGIVAEVERPAFSSLKGLRRVLALDGVADPGNVGTLLRTALALGWEGVFLLDNCCDPYNDKALRAAMGSTFRLQLRLGNTSALKQLAQENSWHCLAADLTGHRPDAVDGSRPLLLVLGSEARGVSPDCRAFCESVTIPISGDIDSLNVASAGAILMYVLGKD